MVQERTLLLHVGHVKTGSSYLQSILALSQARLKEAGLFYPDSARTDDARSGRISSGNYRLPEILKGLGTWASAFRGGTRALVFSSEFLFDELLNAPEALDRLREAGLSPRVLLFIRDPLEIIGSAYGQAVKRAGYSGTIDDYVARGGWTHPIPAKVRAFIGMCDAAGVPLCLRNYARHKRDLAAPLADFLGIDASVLERPASASVNRSLTAGERAFMRRLNERLDRKVTARFADALCNRLPDVRSDMPLPSPDALARLATNLNAEIDATNAVIGDPAERYERVDLTALASQGRAEPDVYEFTEEQLAVLAETFAEFLRGEAEPPRTGTRAAAPRRGWRSLLGRDGTSGKR